MIKTWSLENFKSVYNDTSLVMSPLTIFTGANSSGKSTIIQSILLTAQTIQNNISSKFVILNGHIIKLGTFDDILSNNSKSQNIRIGFELEFEHQRNLNRYLNYRTQGVNTSLTVNNYYIFTASSEGNKEITQLNPILNQSNMHVHFINNEEEEDAEVREFINVQKSLEDISQRKIKLKLPVEGIEYQDSLEYTVETNGRPDIFQLFSVGEEKIPQGARMFHFLPDTLFAVHNKAQEAAKRLIYLYTNPDNRYRVLTSKSLKGNLTPKFVELVMEEIHFISLSRTNEKNELIELRDFSERLKLLKEEFNVKNLHLFLDILTEEMKKDYEIRMKEKEEDLLRALMEEKETHLELAPMDLSDALINGRESISNFFSKKVKYLGPLRDEPKPIYPYSGTTDSKDVGFKGEFTAAVLEIHKDTKVTYISPNSDENMNKKRSVPLIEAVLDWLQYMGVAEKVKTTDQGKLGHELKVMVEDGRGFHDLTNVGVGVSQVLPILVLSLLSEEGSSLIFEQPELHLHPRVQTRLADFFVSMMQLNKQCIIESHSEYLINRLRYRSVISENEEISKNVMIYFVEKENGKSHYNQVRINKFGVIEDWPKGFFDENEKNSAHILKAAMSKRKKEKEKND